jgi:hypothetical protein
MKQSHKLLLLITITQCVTENVKGFVTTIAKSPLLRILPNFFIAQSIGMEFVMFVVA